MSMRKSKHLVKSKKMKNEESKSISAHFYNHDNIDEPIINDSNQSSISISSNNYPDSSCWPKDFLYDIDNYFELGFPNANEYALQLASAYPNKDTFINKGWFKYISLWRFDYDRGSLSYVKKFDTFLLFTLSILVIISANIQDSPVLIPSVTCTIIYGILALLKDVISAYINRIIETRVIDIWRCVSANNVIHPNFDEKNKFCYDGKRFIWYLDLKNITDMLDKIFTRSNNLIVSSYSIGPYSAQMTPIIRFVAYFIHFIIYFSPLILISNLDRQYQLISCAILGSLILFFMLIILIMDAFRLECWTNLIIDTYIYRMTYFHRELTDKSLEPQFRVKSEIESKYGEFSFIRWFNAVSYCLCNHNS